MEKAELLAYFDEKLFIPSLQARSKDGVLEEMVSAFVKAEIVRNPAIILQMVRKREELGSTGIGHGIAIPHGRTTAAPDLKIAFGYSKRGIPWDAIDKKQVHLVFMVLAPPQEDDNKYLPVLGRLVEMLSSEDEREMLSTVKDFEEFTKQFQS